jgi:hypothetical protein
MDTFPQNKRSTAPSTNRLPETVARLAARGLADGSWWQPGRATAGSILNRAGVPEPTLTQAVELASQFNGWALRGQGMAPDAHAVRVRVPAADGLSELVLDRRRSAEAGWEYRLQPAPPAPPAHKPRATAPRATAAAAAPAAAPALEAPAPAAEAPALDEAAALEAAPAPSPVEASVPPVTGTADEDAAPDAAPVVEPAAEASAAPAVESAPAAELAPAAPAVEASAEADAPGAPKRCAVPGCEGWGRTKGLCNSHYNRDLRARRAAAKAAAVPPAPCIEPGCQRAARIKGRCQPHYKRAYHQSTAERANERRRRRTAARRGEAPPPDLLEVQAAPVPQAGPVAEAEAKAAAVLAEAEVQARGLVADAEARAAALRAEAQRIAQAVVRTARRTLGAWVVLARDARGDATAAERRNAGGDRVCAIERDPRWGHWDVTVWPPPPVPGEPPAPEVLRLRAQTQRRAAVLADEAALGFTSSKSEV